VRTNPVFVGIGVLAFSKKMKELSFFSQDKLMDNPENIDNYGILAFSKNEGTHFFVTR
jgi:hypothetical protein